MDRPAADELLLDDGGGDGVQVPDRCGVLLRLSAAERQSGALPRVRLLLGDARAERDILRRLPGVVQGPFPDEHHHHHDRHDTRRLPRRRRQHAHTLLHVPERQDDQALQARTLRSRNIDQSVAYQKYQVIDFVF